MAATDLMYELWRSNFIDRTEQWIQDNDDGSGDVRCYWCREVLGLEFWVEVSDHFFPLCQPCIDTYHRCGEPPFRGAWQRSRTKVFHLTPAVRDIEAVTDLITDFLRNRWER